MSRLSFQIRALLVALLFGVGLAFGVSAAIAGTPPCAGPAGIHQTDDAAPVVVDTACQDRGYAPDAPTCCTDMIAGSCGLAALTQHGAPLATIRELDRSGWLAGPVHMLVGLDPQAGRRPPRFTA